MSSVLVTGGAGYIGSHVALALLDRGENVVVLDDLSAGPPVTELEGVVFVEGAVEDSALVSKLIKEHGIDSIIHMAGFIKVEESVREPEKYFKNNTENTKSLVETATKNGITYFVFSSTAAVYGNPTHVPISEGDSTTPVNPYGESKLRAEKFIANATGIGSAMHSVIFRYFNVAGTDPTLRAGYRREQNPTHLIRNAIRAATEGGELTIFGSDYSTPDGTCVRDYVHVSDLAGAHVEALNYLRTGGASNIFNYGYGRGYSVAEVVETVGRVSGKKISVKYGPRRAGDPAILVADSSRIKRELHIKPKYDDLDTIITHELAWVTSQQNKIV